MFIRESSKKINGKIYIQFQLMQSVRLKSGPRNNLILNLGDLSLPKEKLKILANLIEIKLTKEASLIHAEYDDPELQNLAEHYANIIVKNRINAIKENVSANLADTISLAEDEEIITVKAKNVENSDTRSVGPEHVVVSQIEEYRLDAVLSTLGFDKNQIDYTKILIAGRLIHPASERETARWASEDSSITEFLNPELKIYDNALHRTACKLLENSEQIETQLALKAKKIFSLEESVLLYDLTNTYFESGKENSEIAKYNMKSKEKRSDCPVMSLSLVVDEDGFPKRSKVLKGNISEPSTLKEVLEDLSSDNNIFTKTIVLDAGIASEDNLKLISDYNFKYIVVSRKQSYGEKFWDDSPETEIFEPDGKIKLTLKSVRTEDEVFLCCHSPSKEAKEKAMLENKIKKFIAEIEELKKGLAKKNTQKGVIKISERIGRLKQKYGVGNLYNIKITEDGGLAKDIICSSNEKGKAKNENCGNYVLRSNRLDLSDEKISQVHRSLTTVEECFRIMKSNLGLRPNFHINDDAMSAHIFITVLAYHIVAPILKKLKNNEINYQWDTVKNILHTHSRTTTSLVDETTGTTFFIRTTGSTRIKQKEIYKALNITNSPLSRKIAKIQTKKM